jgi:hypothetical protein
MGAHLYRCVKRTSHLPLGQPSFDAPGRPCVYLPSKLDSLVFSKTPLAWEIALL